MGTDANDTKLSVCRSTVERQLFNKKRSRNIIFIFFFSHLTFIGSFEPAFDSRSSTN